MTRLVKTICLIAMVVTSAQIVSACYPRSHQFTSRPEVSGILLKGGVPINGARVMIAHTRGDDGNYCRGALVAAVTTEDGRFRVRAATNLHFFASLLNQPRDVLEMTSVCFELPAQQKFGVLLLAPTDRETSYALSCDLDSPPVEFKQHVIWSKNKWGICQNVG